MVSEGNFQFPTIPQSAMPILNLEDDEPNREARIMFSQLPFHFISIGNRTKNSHHKLSIDSSVDWSYFTYQKLIARFTRPIAKHPTNPTEIQGLLFIGKSL